MNKQIVATSTASLSNGEKIAVRKCSDPEDDLLQIYDTLKVDHSMPLQKQFEKVGKNIYRHKLKATDEEDYNKLLDVAKAYSASGMKVWLLPEVHKNEVGVRKLLSLPSETKTPDMMLNRSILVDVKSPESYRKIEHNANKASKQGGIACITNHSMHLVYSKLEALSKQILNNKEYMKDEVHFYIDGTIYKYNSQGRILD